MNILQKQTKNVFRVSRIFYFNSNTRMNAMTSHLRWKFDITKGQGIGKICLVLLGFVLILVFTITEEKNIVIPRTLLYCPLNRGSLYQGCTVQYCADSLLLRRFVFRKVEASDW